VVDVPRAQSTSRPYFVPDATQATADRANATIAEFALPILATVYAILLAVVWFGFERREQW